MPFSERRRTVTTAVGNVPVGSSAPAGVPGFAGQYAGMAGQPNFIFSIADYLASGCQIENGPNDCAPEKVAPPQPPQPQGPPPIPLKFYGFATQTGQAKRVFLASTNSDDVFVGSEGQVINRRYRIVKVSNTSVDDEDILNNNKQTIPLTPQT